MGEEKATPQSLAPKPGTVSSPTPGLMKKCRLDAVLFSLLLLVEVAPIWWFEYFPSSDGPSHIENATILRWYHDPDWAFVRDFYTISPSPNPNWVGHLVLAGLIGVVPPLIAEKILLTGYLVLLPISARYAMRAVRADAGFLALLVFPFVPNLFLHMGFYNFCYSLPQFFLVVGYWLKYRTRFRPRRTLILGALGLVLYFCHLVSLAAAWVVIAVDAAWLAHLDVKGRSKAERNGALQFVRSWWATIAPVAWAFLPTILLAAWFIMGHARPPNLAENRDGSTLAMLLKLEALVSYSIAEGLPALGVSLFCLVLTGYLLKQLLRVVRAQPADGLLVAAVVLVIVCLAVPPALAGGLFVNLRLTLYPFFALFLWFAAQAGCDRCRWAIRFAATAAAISFAALHATVYAQANEYMCEMLAVADAIEPDHTLFALRLVPPNCAPDGRQLSSRVPLFQHVEGHIAGRRRLVNLKNYEATSGTFPIRYRPDLDPYLLMGQDDKLLDRGLHAAPPHVDLLAYEKATGRPIDYVLIWGVWSESPSDTASKEIMAQLKAGGYEKVHHASRRGFAHLYRRRHGE
jgi:hypothetical protein